MKNRGQGRAISNGGVLRRLALLAFAWAGCGASFLQAADLTVAVGETVTLAESAEYDSVTVGGVLNIPVGLTLKAGALALGPDAGDAAVINVLGNALLIFGLHLGVLTGTVTIGANGGAGGAEGAVSPWISGSGVLRVRKGGGLVILVR